jgi:dienelactone hydrolase
LATCVYSRYLWWGNKDNAEAGKNQNSKPITEYKRESLALDQLIRAGANSDNIVVIGYCFGGTGRLKPHVDI